MIVLIYGTTAEAIKFAPLMTLFKERDIPFEQWLTLQQASTVLNSLPNLDISSPDIVITNGVKGRPLASTWDTARWSLAIFRWFVSNRSSLKKRLGKDSIILVHGDTLTSVVGALIGKGLGITVGHVEAGLRSGSWRHPFPEELDRRIVGKIADIHYAPSNAAVKALAGKPNVIYTHGNTALDALVKKFGAPRKIHADKKYGLVLLHRFEFLNNAKLVEETISALAANTPLPLTIVADDHAKHVISEAVSKNGSPQLVVVDKLSHSDFVKLASGAEFVVTDSGGVQEEMGFLGTPTLIHRKATERSDGLGHNVVLSDWSIPTLTAFLDNYSQHSRPRATLDISPSDIIVTDLQGRGYGT